MADQRWTYAAISAILVFASNGLTAQELRIDPAPVGDELQLHFPARTGSYYHILQAGPNALSSTNWPVVHVLDGSKGAGMWSRPWLTATNERAYYRIRGVPLDMHWDADGDGLPDAWELRHGFHPLDEGAVDAENGAWGDPDGDGLANLDEFWTGADPGRSDTNGDGVPDGEEKEYADILHAFRVLDLDALAARFAEQRDVFVRMAPPSTKVLSQAGTPDPILFDPGFFPASFRNNLPADSVGGSAVYRITIAEDPQTRETVFLNHRGEQLAARPPPVSYNPKSALLQHVPDIYSGTYSREEIALLEKMCDPSRVRMTYALLRPGDLAAYLSRSAGETGKVQQAVQEPVATGIRFVGMTHTANGLALNIGYAPEYSGTVWEVYAYAAGKETADAYLGIDNVYALAETGLVLTGATHTVWVDTNALGTGGSGFYALGHAGVDQDGDGLPDARERLVHKTSPLAADTDEDGIDDQQEVAHGLDPLMPDSYADADEDRYPNIYEIHHGSDPHDALDGPPAGDMLIVGPGQRFRDIQSAVDEAITNGSDYAVIKVLPGFYEPVRILSRFVAGVGTVKRKLLLLSEAGARDTVVDAGGLDKPCIEISTEAVVDGFTLQNSTESFQGSGLKIRSDAYIQHCVIRSNAHEFVAGTIYCGAGKQVFKNCLVVNNVSRNGGGATVGAGSEVRFIHCTFFGNRGFGNSVYSFGSGPIEVINSILWGAGGSGEIGGNAQGVRVTHSIVRGGWGDDPTVVDQDPHLSSEGYLTAASSAALNAAPDLGLSSDVELESRPQGVGADIGADEYGPGASMADEDGDGLPDSWEALHGLDPTTAQGANGADGDPDGDGFTNFEEFTYKTRPRDASSVVGPMIYDYDDIDRLTGVRFPNGREVKYRYDLDGNLLELP